MKTNGIPSQVNNVWNQAQSAFGAAQEVQKAVDKGGFACGMSEGINQFCQDKNNVVAKLLVGFNESAIGKFFIKKMFHLNFNEQGDSVEISTDNIAEAVGQKGKLGEFVLQMVNGNKEEGGWLTNFCSKICTGCSSVASKLVGSLIEKIPNENLRKFLKGILTKDEVSSKKYNKEEMRKERDKECKDIEAKIKNDKDFTLDDLKDEISDCKVSLREEDKDELYIKWARAHKDIGHGDKRKVFSMLSDTAKENLGFNSDLSGSARTTSRNEAIERLFLE